MFFEFVECKNIFELKFFDFFCWKRTLKIENMEQFLKYYESPEYENSPDLQPQEIPPSPADSELIQFLGTDRFIKLNSAVLEGEIRSYKREVEPACYKLLENEKIIGCILSETPPDNNNQNVNNDWYKDPNSLSNYEIHQAIHKIQELLKKQREINHREKKGVEILDSARNKLNLDLGFHLVELIDLEKQ